MATRLRHAGFRRGPGCYPTASRKVPNALAIHRDALAIHADALPIHRDALPIIADAFAIDRGAVPSMADAFGLDRASSGTMGERTAHPTRLRWAYGHCPPA